MYADVLAEQPIDPTTHQPTEPKGIEIIAADGKRFVQFDLEYQEVLYEDFYDNLIIAERETEESIPFEAIRQKLKTQGLLQKGKQTLKTHWLSMI